MSKFVCFTRRQGERLRLETSDGEIVVTIKPNPKRPSDGSVRVLCEVPESVWVGRLPREEAPSADVA